MMDRWLIFLAGSILGGLVAWGLAALRQGLEPVPLERVERVTRPVEPNVVPAAFTWSEEERRIWRVPYERLN